MTAGQPDLDLCGLDEIPEGAARGFEIPGSEGALELIVLRRGGTVTAYVNACPHQGTPLNIAEDRFFTRDGRHLLCRTHGARFRPEDGLCVSGPCSGASLAGHPVRIADGRVFAAPGTGGASA